MVVRMQTTRWVINEKDIIQRRQEVELAKAYKDAYLAWDNYYKRCEDDYYKEHRFGIAPVKDGSLYVSNPGPYVWKDHIVYKKPCVKKIQVTPPEVVRFFDKILLTKPPTMVFKRYDNLLSPEENLDILVKALLGFPKPMGYKQGNNCAILNDSWEIDWRTTREENIMMDAFLRGWGKPEELKKAQEAKRMVNVTEELNDLLRVYTDAEEHLKDKEEQALSSLEGAMKRYLNAKEERSKMTQKLSVLTQKMSMAEEEEEDDE